MKKTKYYFLFLGDVSACNPNKQFIVETDTDWSQDANARSGEGKVIARNSQAYWPLKHISSGWAREWFPKKGFTTWIKVDANYLDYMDEKITPVCDVILTTKEGSTVTFSNMKLNCLKDSCYDIGSAIWTPDGLDEVVEQVIVEKED